MTDPSQKDPKITVDGVVPTAARPIDIGGEGLVVPWQNGYDAPACHECGSIMVKRGAFLACLNCGAMRTPPKPRRDPADLLVNARLSDLPWTTRAIDDLGDEAKYQASCRRADEHAVARIDAAVDEARASGVPEASIRARLEGLADDSRRAEQAAKRAVEAAKREAGE